MSTDDLHGDDHPETARPGPNEPQLGDKQSAEPGTAAAQFAANVGVVGRPTDHITPIDVSTHMWTVPPDDACCCDAFALRRPGLNETPGSQGVGLARIGGGGIALPPLAQLALAPGSYIVSANATISAANNNGMVFAMLGTRGQGNLAWTWLTLASHSAPGCNQILHLQCAVTFAASDAPIDRVVGLDAYGGTVDRQFQAFNIWLIAQEVGKATVITQT